MQRFDVPAHDHFLSLTTGEENLSRQSVTRWWSWFVADPRNEGVAIARCDRTCVRVLSPQAPPEVEEERENESSDQAMRHDVRERTTRVEQSWRRVLVHARELHVVVHRELVWMRTQPERVVFLLLHLDPVVDEVGVEDVAAEQELMICFQRVDCAA